MKKMKGKQKFALAAVIVLSLVLLIGCTTASAAYRGSSHHHSSRVCTNPGTNCNDTNYSNQSNYNNYPNHNSSCVTMEAAQAAALTQLGFTKEQARFVADECELDDGVYELELWSGGVEYECRVDAATGTVLQAVRDWDDDAVSWGQHHNNTQSHHSGGHHHGWDD